MALTIKEAFYLASSGRPGPVLIDLPVDVQRKETKYHYPEAIDVRTYNPTFSGHPLQIKKAAALIENSKRPVIYAGGGVILSGASSQLRKLAEITNIPVTMTLLGLGGFPGEHPLSLGMLGMHGTRFANYAVMESDLIIAIGARFDDRVTGKIETFAPDAKVIHIDVDPSAISKNVKVDVPIVGDARNILEELIKKVKPLPLEGWHKKINDWKIKYPVTYKKDDKLRPQYVIEQIYQLTKGEAIITTEVGQNQMWAAQFCKYSKPRTFLTSGGLGTMGYGFPAAIGAQLGCPGKIIFDIAGDGSFQMNIQELTTAVVNHIPVKIAILNNGYLGMVRQWQELFYGKRYSYTSLGEGPDFVKVAKAFGARGIRVNKKSEVKKAIEEAIAEKKLPTVIDFHVEPEENVFPIVPAGAGLNQMIGGLA